MTSASSAVSVGYWRLLKQNDRFRRLWAAQLISAAGDWFNSVAVLGLVLQLTQSGLNASLVLISSTLPTFFLTPIAGPLVDRLDRRTVMIWTNLFSAGVALLFLLVHDTNMIWLLYVASVMLVISAAFFAPASSASIPNIVSQSELFSANALSGATWGVMVMVGSALGGIVSTLFGRNIAFIVNALSFLIAAGLIASIEIPSPKREKRIAPWQDFVEGVRYLRNFMPSLSLVAVKFGWGFGAGSLVLLSVFGQQVFKAGDAGIGILYSGRGLGALIGPFVIRSFVGENVDRLRRAMWLSFLLAGLGYLLLALSGWWNAIWLGFVALVIAHFGGGTVWAISSVLLQLTTPDYLRGRVLSVDYGLNTLTNGISTLLYGLALQGNTSPLLLAVVGAVTFSAYGIFWGVISSRGPLQISEATVTRPTLKP
ncbi:MAG: MFS transporter [Anaerolineae bacterium]|nr:MFS transporter [Anaerolineae bacterium]